MCSANFAGAVAVLAVAVTVQSAIAAGPSSPPLGWQSVVCPRGPGSCRLVDGASAPGAWAAARIEPDMSRDGWAKLWVRGIAANSGDEWYAAGFAEGALTARMIRQHYDSWYSVTFSKEKPFLEETKAFLLDNYEFAQALVEDAASDDPYYQRLNDLLMQVSGMFDGMQASAPAHERLELHELLVLLAAGDLYDVIPATKPEAFALRVGEIAKDEFYHEWHRAVSCSALIKASPDLQHVFAGHTTWSFYENMLRIFKHFELSGSKVSYSSKPGLLYSKDDFYVLPSPAQRMIVIETTNGIMDPTVYETISPSSLLTWQRIPVVNSLATRGEEWTEMFKRHSSGTYANQWMVVDLKRWVGSRGPRPGFLWIIEVAGSKIAESMDVTAVFQAQDHAWPSYNIPYIESVYNATGFSKAYATYGDEYSYHRCPRRQIFDRDMGKIAKLEDLERILRYNDFKHDPLSLGDAANAISARKDLNPNAIANGGIDTKVTSSDMVFGNDPVIARAQNGPTHDDLPPFRWSTSKFAANVHDGQPDLFNFTFVSMHRDDLDGEIVSPQ